MLYPRPIFGTLAALYCLCLGGFALFQNRKSKVNVAFSLFHFMVAMGNISEYTIFFSDHEAGLWYLRLTRTATCFMVPYFMLFVYELLDVAKRPLNKTLFHISLTSALIVALLHLTPTIYQDVRYLPFSSHELVEVPGPLFGLFALHIFFGFFGAMGPAVQIYKEASGLKKTQITYLMLASAIGLLAMILFIISFVFKSWPRTYYPIQVLFSFTFAYAIFKHDLIPTRLAFRRSMLVLGIYVAIFMMLVPLAFVFYKSSFHVGGMRVIFLMTFMAVVGLFFSLGPIIYSLMVHHSSLFQDRVSAEITHGFKTPLAAIQSAHAILEDELAEATPNKKMVHDYLDLINRNTTRLQKFVGDVLDFSRVRASFKVEKYEPVDLIDMLYDIGQDFPDLEGRLNFPGVQELKIYCVREGLRQILSNLISNAEKFGSQGLISVSVQDKGMKVEIAVKDVGLGIAKENLERIFDPFFRTGEGTDPIKGTGLGLAIVKKWVEFHNGKTWAESPGLGKGATFFVSLPKS